MAGSVARVPVSGEWRLHWDESMQPVPGLDRGAGEATTLWVGSDDPEHLRAFALGQCWHPDQILRFTFRPEHSTSSPVENRLCHLSDVHDWIPGESLLPAPSTSAIISTKPSAARLALLQAMRIGVDQAVECDVLEQEDAVGLMLMVAKLLEKREG